MRILIVGQANKRIVMRVFAAIVVMVLGLIAQVFAQEAGTLSKPIVDSNMTFEEAIRKGCPPEIKKNLRLVEVLYYSFDGKIHKGQLVVDRRLVRDVRKVFKIALKEKFPITSVIPISHERFFKDGKWNDDNQSMLANNTSAFNYRVVTGGTTLSKHSYGFAIDINPVQNPYIKNGKVLPDGAVYDVSRPGTLSPGCRIVKTFLRLGWEWGGNWKTLKDYQHFEKVFQSSSNSFGVMIEAKGMGVQKKIGLIRDFGVLTESGI